MAELQHSYATLSLAEHHEVAANDPTGNAVNVLYTNYRGETAVRRIVPQRIWFGSTEWHPEPGWLLDAFDLEKQAERSFAMNAIKAWFIQ